ncbi:diphosphoinositol-polyphosphate diphosphatase [Nematocida sp. AWRm77]|nr:diphosphoinositol-polyphosphate diphosphatase [Nematocida sp. AWRm77]
MFIKTNAGPDLKRLRLRRKGGAKKQNRKMVGCIPVHNGSLYLVTGRNKYKLLFPKGGSPDSEKGYYSAGKEALEEVGLIGNIDTEPITKEGEIDWYILEVTRVLDDWKERHERLRMKMSIDDVLQHSEVRAATKVVLKSAIIAEEKTGRKRIVMPKRLFQDE